MRPMAHETSAAAIATKPTNQTAVNWEFGIRASFSSWLVNFGDLAIANLQARDIIGYTTVAMLVGLIVVCGSLTLFLVVL